MLVFESPLVLLLLSLIPLLVYFRHIRANRGGTLSFPFQIYRGSGFEPRNAGLIIFYGFLIVVFWLSVVTMLLAFAGPTWVTRERVYLNPGVSMMIALDESPSMAARDFQPENRFETAREVVRRFVERRENDPIGLVSFGLEAALRVPPTLDYEHLLSRLDSLEILGLGDGTAIGMGLAVAGLHLESASGDDRVIILLTDGENNAGEIAPETAARVVSDLGVRIYTIGIGSEEETDLEFTDPNTGQTFRGTFEGGFDEDLLERIAVESGGAYFYAGNSGTLEAVFDAIDSLESVERRVRVQVQSLSLHSFFILFALVGFGVDFVGRRLLLGEVL